MPKRPFYCIDELPVNNTEEFCTWLLSEFNLNGTTVMLAPANGFYSQKNNINNQVRIAYVLEIKQLELAVEIIEKGLKEYNAQ